MERTQFTFYESFRKAIGRIKKKTDRADAYDAICDYALYGTEPNLDKLSDAAAIVFDLIKPNLDTSRRKAANGQTGGKGKQTASKPEANKKQTASKKEGEKTPAPATEGAPQIFRRLLPEYNLSDDLKAKMAEWLTYKTERRESYKETGLKALLRQVENNANKYGSQAVCDVIDASMASGWVGIAFDRLKAQGQKPGGHQKQTKADELQDFYNMAANWAAGSGEA